MRRIQCLVIYERTRRNIYLIIFSFPPKNTSYSPFTINFKAFILTWPSYPFTRMLSTLPILPYLHYNIKITSIIPFKPSINYFQDSSSLHLKLDYSKQPHAYKRTSCPQSRRWMPKFMLGFCQGLMTSWIWRHIWPCGVPLFGAHVTVSKTQTSLGLVPLIGPPCLFMNDIV